MAKGDATVEVDGREVRVSSADRVIFPATERTPELTRKQLRDERARSLSRATELHDPGAVIVPFDDGRQRAPFTQRHHVMRGSDGSNHRRPIVGGLVWAGAAGIEDVAGAPGLRMEPACRD